MAWLLDTNVLSEAWRPAPNRKVLSWLDRNAAASYISALSMGEIWRGSRLLPTARRALFEARVAELEEANADRFLAVDTVVTKRWGAYAANQAKLGRTLDLIDSLIGATALAHDLTVVTRNTADFPDIRTLNPWA